MPEIRHLLAYALRAAGQIEIALSSDGFWVRGNNSDGLIRFRGLPLTEQIVELLLPFISPPKSLRGEARPNLTLGAKIARAVERNPKISNRALALKLGAAESTVRRYRRPK